MTYGADVSNNQNGSVPADFAQLGFVFAKVSEGVAFTDRAFPGYATKCHAAGVILGGYHFCHADANKARDEAAYFIARSGGAALLAVDVESRAGHDPLGLMGARALAQWVNDWCSQVRDATGITPYVYMNKSYLSALAPFLGSWPIWLATLNGKPQSPSWAGRVIAIEQYAIEAGFDRNIAYVDLGHPHPDPTPTPPTISGDEMVRLMRADKDPAVYVVSNDVSRFGIPDPFWLADFHDRFGAQILPATVGGPTVSIDTVNGVKVEVVNPLFLAVIPIRK